VHAEAGERGGEERAADVVEEDIDARGSVLGDGGFEVGGFAVVDGGIEAKFVDEDAALLGGADCVDDAAAFEFGDLADHLSSAPLAAKIRTVSPGWMAPTSRMPNQAVIPVVLSGPTQSSGVPSAESIFWRAAAGRVGWLCQPGWVATRSPGAMPSMLLSRTPQRPPARMISLSRSGGRSRGHRSSRRA